ncbi:hypothetical protein EDB80DRAFT_674980 [Ilyonectria destructans]|nr:hypothetical protein EDB80DRAFT_674980 [Ilyonectria destructans]
MTAGGVGDVVFVSFWLEVWRPNNGALGERRVQAPQPREAKIGCCISASPTKIGCAIAGTVWLVSVSGCALLGALSAANCQIPAGTRGSCHCVPPRVPESATLYKTSRWCWRAVWLRSTNRRDVTPAFSKAAAMYVNTDGDTLFEVGFSKREAREERGTDTDEAQHRDPDASRLALRRHHRFSGARARRARSHAHDGIS